MNLSGKRALVTGGGKRIGKAIALALAAEGCDVLVHHFSSEDGAKAVAAEIERLGRKTKTLKVDLRSDGGPKDLAARAIEAFGGLDILINNASVYPVPGQRDAGKDILHETMEDWELSLSVNARAPFFLIQALASELKRAGNGNVVNILDSSISTPFYSRASHTVSKCALAAVTKLAAGTLNPYVRVNAVELGKILPPEGLPPADAKHYSWSGAESAVKAVLFLLKNDFVNGEIVSVRGNDALPNFQEKGEW